MPITEGFTSRTAAVRALKWDESAHPRKPSGSGQGGEFTSGGGSSEGTVGGGMSVMRTHTEVPHEHPPKRLTNAQRSMQAGLRRQAKKPVHLVKTPEEGVALILKGENVELQDTQHVHTVLKLLGEMAIKAKAMKEKAPNFDPCKITVKGTSLFCSEKIKTTDFPHGVPRIEMPQFKSKNPVPGSPADGLTRDAGGEVDATDLFIRDLERAGVKTDHHDTALARKLKASQAEMEGVKVAGMMVSKDRDPKKARIIISRDNYVVDGHHTWAAAVGRDAEDGNLDNDMEMEVVRVDLPMSEIYHLSVDWTKQMGLPQAGVKKRDYFTIFQSRWRSPS